MARGYHVLGLDRYFFGQDKLGDLTSNPLFELVVQDIRHLDPQLLKGVYGVIDLAGLSNDLSAEIDPDLTRQINFEGVRRLRGRPRPPVYAVMFMRVRPRCMDTD